MLPIGWLFLMLLMVLNDLSDDEVQEILGEFRIQIGPLRKIFKTCDLFRFAIRIGRGKVVFGFQFSNCLRGFEALAQGVDKDRIEPVNALAIPFEQVGGAGGVVSQERSLSV
ncbi:hypothetical protein SAMN04488036_10989 [Shimia haliotis]|uniref:Uncharacterized protein n=1 Tax=Shimia haliotis TaxID=1280847 RepID=A0A1I4GQA6_9RHOB|nr:hypothetical protein SAMN04488036_10989 [Shimia haliotis]